MIRRHVLHGDRSRLRERGVIVLVIKLRTPLSVGHRHRHHAAGHTIQPGRVAGVDPEEHGTTFELLGAVAHEARPGFSSRNQIFHLRHHLAAVAHAEQQAIRLGEARKLVRKLSVESEGLGPATTATQHIAVGKAAARYERRKVLQADLTGEQIAHVHIHGFETAALEHRRHFQVAVHPLLPQHGDA